MAVVTVAVMSRKALVTKEELLALHARYMAGEGSADELGAEVGYGRNGLSAAFWRAGLPMLGRGPRPMRADDPRAEQALALWDSGLGMRRIEREFGFNGRTLAGLLQRTGRDPAARKRGSGHHRWQGGRYVDSEGYARVRVEADDPMASMRNANGEVREHRLVMARMLRRPLGSHETVHHRNGDKLDNRLRNLQLRLGNHGSGIAAVCRACGSHDIAFEEV